MAGCCSGAKKQVMEFASKSVGMASDTPEVTRFKDMLVKACNVEVVRIRTPTVPEFLWLFVEFVISFITTIFTIPGVNTLFMQTGISEVTKLPGIRHVAKFLGGVLRFLCTRAATEGYRISCLDASGTPFFTLVGIQPKNKTCWKKINGGAGREIVIEFKDAAGVSYVTYHMPGVSCCKGRKAGYLLVGGPNEDGSNLKDMQKLDTVKAGGCFDNCCKLHKIMVKSANAVIRVPFFLNIAPTTTGWRLTEKKNGEYWAMRAIPFVSTLNAFLSKTTVECPPNMVPIQSGCFGKGKVAESEGPHAVKFRNLLKYNSVYPEGNDDPAIERLSMVLNCIWFDYRRVLDY